MRKKHNVWLYRLFWIGMGLLVFTNCNDNNPETVTDIDGNVYRTITIGKQVWMAGNLKVTRYRNGDLIPNVTDGLLWNDMPVGAYCNYDNNDSIVGTYGRLYNWYAISDIRKIAPKGWHIPDIGEIKCLVANLGDDIEASGKMKETGLAHWLCPNTGATNESCFSALPGGYRFNIDGTFHTIGSNGYWWTTTESFEMYAWSQRLYFRFADVERDFDYRTYGFSVRCVKD